MQICQSFRVLSFSATQLPGPALHCRQVRWLKLPSLWSSGSHHQTNSASRSVNEKGSIVSSMMLSRPECREASQGPEWDLTRGGSRGLRLFHSSEPATAPAYALSPFIQIFARVTYPKLGPFLYAVPRSPQHHCLKPSQRCPKPRTTCPVQRFHAGIPKRAGIWKLAQCLPPEWYVPAQSQVVRTSSSQAVLCRDPAT